MWLPFVDRPYPYWSGVLEVFRVEGRIFWKRLSKALRNGGRDAMRMPMDNSEELHMVRLTPDQVGSLVSVIVFNSMVLNMEQIVALFDCQLSDLLSDESGDTHGMLSKKTIRMPHCVLRDS